jgi:hypothetical protein
MKKFFAAIAALAALSVTACTKHETQVVYQNPPANVLQSFSTACGQDNCLKIEKSSLQKVFLLLISGKSNDATPQWMDLKPSVVVFEKSNSQLALFAVNLDSVYGVEDSRELIQAFRILAEDATTITFDWGQGLESFHMESSYGTETKDPDEYRPSVKIMNSFIRSVGVTNENIEISQVSKVQSTSLVSTKDNPSDPKSGSSQSLRTTDETYNLNIQLIPNVENKNFQPKEADLSRTVGFFVTSMGVPEYARKTKNLIMKWDLTGTQGPVKFLISPTTPADYVQAVTEGLLYWNKVLGFEAVKVEIAASDRVVPPLHSVMVRWIPWQDAGFAYASVQANPLTGESLRGQIMMTPAWLHGKGKGQKLAPIVNPMVSCDWSEANASTPDDYPDNPLDLRIAQDRVRDVIAHESGHVMGLRHNFAGSSSVKIGANQVLNRLREYLVDPQDKGELTSTSIMDYIKGPEEVLLGKYIQTGALPYDQMAMKWAYGNDAKDLNPALSGYCSDEDISLAQQKKKSEIYDCRRFDAAGSQFVLLIDDELKARSQALQTKYADILNVLFPSDEPTYVNSLDRLLEENHPDLQLKPLQGQMSFYRSHDAVISLEKWRNEVQREYTTAKDPALDQMLQRDLNEVGGLSHVKELLTPKVSGWTQADLQAVLTLVGSAQGTTKSGRAYQLSSDQQNQLAAYFKNEAQYLEAQLQKELNEMFQGL